MNSLKGYILLAGLLLWLLPASATHLVGGEFEVKHLPDGTYDVFLNVYFDAVSGDPGAEESSIVVSTFRKRDNVIVESFIVGRIGSTMVPYSDPACQRGDLQTKLIRYKANRNMSPAQYGDPDGYYLVWERCCRNNGINNIRNPDAAGMVYYLEFPPVIRNNQPFINSTPVLGPVPADYLCVNELFTFDINGKDADGDSLVYFLSTPLNGHTSRTNPSLSGLSAPYSPIIWENGFNASQAILGNPNLQINPQTGRLTVRPRFSGLFVFSITCEEYRNGVKIGEVRREVQVRVLQCPTNTAPTVTLTKPDGTPYSVTDTLIVTDATDYCFEVEFTDPDRGQVLTLEAKPVNFTANPILSVTSATVTDGGTITKSRLCWPDCAINSPDKIYLIDLIVKDNGCS
ncbi:MAG TPA: hypothetical protein VK927_00925, partial [Adhaeribacter sp.]|nr:hypothetical protein [Adhaeribacter sp.]